MLIPVKGSLERVLLDCMIELGDSGKGRGVTYFDLIGTGVTEENIDQIAQNLRNGMFVSERDDELKADA